MRVVLFIGHRGVGTGASWEHLDEHELAHKAACAIGATLMLRGHQPFVITGEGDDYLSERVRLATANKPDLAFCLHFNSHENPEADGCEVFYDPDDTTALGLAMLVAPRIAAGTGVRLRHEADGGVAVDDELLVLNAMVEVCPTAYLEPLFLSNAHDREMLTRAGYFADLARAVADTVDLWERIGGGP